MIYRKQINLKIVLILMLFLALVTFFVGSTFNKEVTLNEEVVDYDSSESDMFAIMVEQEDGTYEEYKDNIWPQKENGYLFNEEKSGCIDENGNMLNNIMDWNNNIIRVKAKKATYCWAYFDIKKDFCKTKEITNLRECLLASENYSETQEEAIEYITNKGSATTSAIAPTITYKEKAERVKGKFLGTYGKYSLSTTYQFNEETGMFTLTGNVKHDIVSDAYINYYTCGSGDECPNLYQIKAYNKEVNESSTRYIITDAVKYIYNAVDSFDSEIGLYKTKDEDGDTFFYRGAVKNNYVSFGGFIWRIVRINGNGSIRMIYSGKSTSATGAEASIGNSQYNLKNWEPVYVGYTYDDSNKVYKENASLATNGVMKSSVLYYYANDFECNMETKKCHITGDLIVGKWSDKHQEALENGYIYTCFKTNSDEDCDYVFKLESYINDTSANGYYISYNTNSYSDAIKNTTDSTIKTYIDTWYEKNIKDKKDSNGILLSDYLSDEVFCNDRQIYTGSGHLMAPSTYYSSYNRVRKFNPSLLCNQDSDKYSVANGNLDYPIALLTIDEAIYAGGKEDSVNNQYYLYTGQTYWTMTPNVYTSGFADSYVWRVRGDGDFYAYSVGVAYAVRPVINLSSNVQVTKGMGTVDKPYEVSLQK